MECIAKPVMSREKPTSDLHTDAAGRCVALSPDVLSRRVGDELVLFDVEQAQYFGLNAPGAAMLEALTTRPSFDAAVEHVRAKFDVAADALREDFRALLSELERSGVVRVVDRTRLASTAAL